MPIPIIAGIMAALGTSAVAGGAAAGAGAVAGGAAATGAVAGGATAATATTAAAAVPVAASAVSAVPAAGAVSSTSTASGVANLGDIISQVSKGLDMKKIDIGELGLQFDNVQGNTDKLDKISQDLERFNQVEGAKAVQGASSARKKAQAGSRGAMNLIPGRIRSRGRL